MTTEDLEAAGWKRHRKGWQSPYTQSVLAKITAFKTERQMVKARAKTASLVTLNQ